MTQLNREQRRRVAQALKKVGNEFGNESVYEISDRDALSQRKRAELAGAITKQFINDHKADLQAILNQQK